MMDNDPDPLPIDGALDLHAFRPADIKFLVPDYLEECRKASIFQVRIIHGKGTGTLRRTVHAILDRLDFVAAYRLAGEDAGSWGATLVSLRPPPQHGETVDAAGHIPRPGSKQPA